MTPKQTMAAVLAAAGVALAVAACDTRDGYGDGRYGAGYGDSCRQLASCDTCTPVLGCGWCSLPSGKGACVADPDECASYPSFSFTWEPSGCHTPADAGAVVTYDAGPATPTDSSVPPPDGGAKGPPPSEPPDAALVNVASPPPDANDTADTGAE